jgi:hypothetical protein
MRKILIIGLLATPKMAIAMLLLHVLERITTLPSPILDAASATETKIAPQVRAHCIGLETRPRPAFDPEIRLCLPDPHGQFTRDSERVREAIVGQ